MSLITSFWFVISFSGCILRLLFFYYDVPNEEVKAISKELDKNKPLANYDIPASTVLVIDANGENRGELKLEEAISAANAEELDLVCVAPNAKVPVCRFMDYRKYCYDMQRRAKENKKNQKMIVVKEIRVSPVIGENDFEVKVKNCREFLADDCKVKITLFYPRGKKRLLQMDSSTRVLDRFKEALADVSVVESVTSQGDKKTGIILVAKKTK